MILQRLPGAIHIMIQHAVTTISGPEVLARAKQFFAERVPLWAAFPEKEGPTWLVLRGQGGEEVVLAVVRRNGATRVRASTLLFDQPVSRFLATLPAADESA
jgi:hypothetical protein